MELLSFGRSHVNVVDGNLTKSSRLTDLPTAIPLDDIPLFEGYSSGLLTFASATCIVFILVGLPGNLITIIALARCKKCEKCCAPLCESHTKATVKVHIDFECDLINIFAQDNSTQQRRSLANNKKSDDLSIDVFDFNENRDDDDDDGGDGDEDEGCNKNSWWTVIQNHLFFLRCLYLEPAVTKSQLMALESNIDKWKNSALCEQFQIQLKDLKRYFGNYLEFPTDENLYVIKAIQDINSYEVLLPNCTIQATFSLASRLEHNCIPNTYRTTDSNNLLTTIRACHKIPKGTHLTTSYSDLFVPTRKRQKYFQQTKFFTCQCVRCTDPTECGSLLSAFSCYDCSILSPMLQPQQLFMDDLGQESVSADDEGDFICLNCKASISCGKAMNIVNEAEWEMGIIEEEEEEQIENDQVIKALLNWLKKWTRMEMVMNIHQENESESFNEKDSSNLRRLHPQNTLVLDVCHTIFLRYSLTIENDDADLTDLELEQKIQIGKHLLSSTTGLAPGISKFRDTVMHDLAKSEILQIIRQMRDQQKCPYENDNLKKRVKVRNATAVFIINLSLSDLLFCCFNLPLAASTFWNRHWIHGELLCEWFPLMRYGLLAVSLFTVLAITINRYVMIGHPRIYPRIYRRKYLGLMVAATWIGAFTSLIPTLQGVYGKFGLDKHIGSCTILMDENNKSPKEFLFAMAFVVPCISIIVCYARIFYIVRKTAMRTHENTHIIPTGSIRIQEQQPPKSNNIHNRDNQFGDEANAQLLDNKTNENLVLSEERNQNYDENQRNRKNKGDSSSENSSSIIYPHGTCGSKILLKYIDSSLDSDLPPSLTGLRMNKEEELNADHNSVSKGVEFTEKGNNKVNGYCETEQKGYHLNTRQEADSAMDESISSVDNNQIYHIKSDNCNQLMSVQVEPSSSSGIDLPLDEESPPSRRFTKSFTASLRRLKQPKDKTNTVRKHSTMNTSGASILYPGRMTAKDRRLLKMILVIFVSFLICYLPITTTKIIKPIEKYHFLNIIGYLLIYLTTCINPIIYVVMSSEYRQAYWNLLMCRTMTRAKQQKELVQKQGSQRT